MRKLYIVLVGLPARGKSFLAERLREGLHADGLRVRIFNNGALRRATLGKESAVPEFYNPNNEEGRLQREKIAQTNSIEARKYLERGGDVAILDATNGSLHRRREIKETLQNEPILFIECLNNDPDILEASIQRKAQLPEFSELSMAEAVESFKRRIRYYESIYTPLSKEECHVKVETLSNQILEEHFCGNIPYYIQIRDILVSDWVRSLYLARHAESEFNRQSRIGGDAPLTEKGRDQAQYLADHFKSMSLPFIITSTRRRSFETAAPIIADHPNSTVISLPELDEIDAGVCNGMTYDEIRRKMPAEYLARSTDKYGYIYPGGEGYTTLKDRVSRGFRKALFLSGAAPGILIIGHQAINRMILSLFLFRSNADVPYIYVPQDEFFHIAATHRKKLVELVRFM